MRLFTSVLRVIIAWAASLVRGFLSHVYILVGGYAYPFSISRPRLKVGPWKVIKKRMRRGITLHKVMCFGIIWTRNEPTYEVIHEKSDSAPRKLSRRREKAQS